MTLEDEYRVADEQSKPVHPKVMEMATRAVLAGAGEERKANDHQPGGDHYLKHGRLGEQHWDRMWRLYGPAWFVCNATKYTERCGDKNGLQDIEKAIHYLTKLKELIVAWKSGNGPPPGNPTWTAFGDITGTVDKVECNHPDNERILIQTPVGNGWKCDLCGHKESN